MSQLAEQQVALNVSAATTELVTHLLAQFPQARIHSRLTPLADEDISLEVVLPMSMEEVYQARDSIFDLVIKLQERYGLLILVSAVPDKVELNETIDSPISC
jgi:hypothetical protein